MIRAILVLFLFCLMLIMFGLTVANNGLMNTLDRDYFEGVKTWKRQVNYKK